MSGERGLSQHERELSSQLYRPSRTLAGTDIPLLDHVNGLAGELKNEKGFVAISLRGSHMLGYESERKFPRTNFSVSDLDICILYDSSAQGFKSGRIFSSIPKQVEKFWKLSEELKVEISVTSLDVAPVLRRTSLPLPGEQGQFLDFAAMLCGWLVYDFNAAGRAKDKQDPHLKKVLGHMNTLFNSSGPALREVFKEKITDRLIGWERDRADKMRERLSDGTEQFDYENIVESRRRMWTRHVNELFG